MSRIFFLSILVLILVSPVYGETMMRADSILKGEFVRYELDGTVMEGYLVYDANSTEKRPGVLVIHEWMGIGEYSIFRAEELAKAGYIAFAADIYGVDVRPTNYEETAQAAGTMYANRELLRARANAALDVLKSSEYCDADRVAAIGYCFGGSTALELARSGADITGIVSFHGGLKTDMPGLENFDGKILICHGADDPHVTPVDVAGFEEEARQAGIDYQIIFYGGAVHSFTNPGAGDDPSRGAAYNANADRRSWIAMINFFNEIF